MEKMYLVNLSQEERFEKLKKWMRQQIPPWSFASFAVPLNLSRAILSRHCRNSTMPVYQHEHLRCLGVPEELLPLPKDRRPGPQPKRNR